MPKQLGPRRHPRRGRQQSPGRPRPRVLATLRNLATGLIRQAGHQSIAGTIRDAEYDKILLLTLLGLHAAP